MRKSKVFDGSEPRLALYSSLITHFRRFRKKSKNRCQKGAQKLCFFVQKRASDAAGSINSAIGSVFGRFQKSLFFCCRSERPKIMKNQSVGRSPCRSSDATLAEVVVPGGKRGVIGDLRSEIVPETGSDTQTRWVGGLCRGSR